MAKMNLAIAPRQAYNKSAKKIRHEQEKKVIHRTLYLKGGVAQCL